MQFEPVLASIPLTPRRFVGLHPSALAYALTRSLFGLELREFRRPRAEELREHSGGQTSRRARILSTPARFESGNHHQMFVVVPNATVAERLADDVRFFLRDTGVNVARFPGWDVLPFDGVSPGVDLIAERLRALDALTHSETSIVIASADALPQRILTPRLFRAGCLSIRVGQPLDRDRFVAALIELGYIRQTVCEEAGQIAVRGSVVDVFSPGSDNPIRIELFQDSIDSLRFFDSSSQRSLHASSKDVLEDPKVAGTPARPGEGLLEVRILPATEFLPFEVDAEKIIRGGVSHSAERRDGLISLLRSRAQELEIPSRLVEPIVEAVRSGSRWPGLEHLLPTVCPALATIWEYLRPDAQVVTCDELATINALDAFEEVVHEQAGRAKTEERLFPRIEDSFDSATVAREYIHKETRLYFDELQFASVEGSAFRDLSGSEGARAVLDTGERLAFDPLTDVSRTLQLSRNTERPLKPLADFLIDEHRKGHRLAIVIAHPPKAKRLEELLEAYEISFDRNAATFDEWANDEREHRSELRVQLILGYLTGGFRSAREGLTVLTDHELFPEVQHRKPSRSISNVRRLLGAVSQLKENDFIVHIDHGLGVYRGLKQLSIEGKKSDFLALEYADGARLFVPVDNIGKVQKYVGSDGVAPPLSKLGGKGWSKTKERVRQNVIELAGQLINLYAEREMVEGISFGEVSEADERFAETFPFEETPDQQKAINDVLNDMASSKPMDRLVCGDVGFGKTEVALRAAFKAVDAGKQVAFLVPTTILADQHFATFQGRLREFKIRVGCVSRYYSPGENKKTLEDAAEGRLDVVVGTHRLLQRDVYFKNLGLLIVDEEHRFGVADKEKLKKFRKEIDVLTLTATPIPRTLYMSLFDIRDLSVIETPPTDRQVIRTYVAPYQESIVREAILRELGRQGQVFLIHNRVASIEAVTEEIRALIPEARVGFGHGQMREDELEKVMHAFINHELDILVSTTIVESGLDIPNANTMIIRDADKLGLAELYQLRGRVGRSSRRAYAYLLIADSKTLGADAKKRLQVLQSLDDLGMGFRLALQDMEIRGAGNLLGKDQSGKIELVGFDLYSRILKEAVREIRSRKGQRSQLEVSLEALIDPELHIGFPVHIPSFYVPDVEERLLMYQRMVELRDESDAQRFSEELEDRFGTLPPDVVTLLEVMVFRGLLRRAGIVSAQFRNSTLSVAFHREVELPADRLLERIQNSRGRLKLSPAMVVSIRIDRPADSPSVLTEELHAVLQSLGISLGIGISLTR